VLLEEFTAIATTDNKQKKIFMCMEPQTEHILYFSGVKEFFGLFFKPIAWLSIYDYQLLHNKGFKSSRSFPITLYSMEHNIGKCILYSYSCNIYTFPLLKQWGLELDHSPPSSVENKNEQNHTSSTPVCFHCVDKKIYLFYVYTHTLAVYLSIAYSVAFSNVI
jgi:hypothetical protein